MKETQTETIFAWRLSLRSGNTRRAYDRIIDSFLEQLPPKRLFDVGPQEIGIFLSAVSESGGQSKYNQARSALASLFDFLIRSGKVAANPVAAFKTKAPRFSKNAFLPSEEIYWKIVGTERNLRNQIMLHSAFVLGLRISEVLSVTPKSIFLDFNRRAFLRVVGKGRVTRDVFLPGWLQILLLDYIGAEKIEQEQKIFFSAKNRSESISYTQAYRVFLAAGRRAGLSIPLGPHKYRHAHATIAIEKGASLKALQDEMGHSHLNTLQKYIEQARMSEPSGLFNAPKALLSEPLNSERDVSAG